MTERGFTDDRLRDSLTEIAEAAGDGRRCLPSERLWRSARGELDAAENEQALLHVAQCAACAMAWRVARDMGTPEESARPGHVSRRVGPSAWVGLAAAAVLASAIGLGVYFRPRPAEVSEPVYRAQEDTVLRSALQQGQRLPREEFVLVWKAVSEGAHYDVLVTTASLDTLIQRAGLEQTEVRVPAETLAELPRGTKVFWQVTAHLPDGRLVESETFIVAIE